MSGKKSKIFLSALAATIFSMQNAFAGEFYFAPSVIFADSEAKYTSRKSGYNMVSERRASEQQTAYGAEVGYHANIAGVIFGPEIYYNKYDTNISKFSNSAHPELNGQDSVRIKDDSGIAVKLGYKLGKVAVFGKLGIGLARSNVAWYNKNGDGMDRRHNEYSMSKLTSVGLSYDLNDFLALRLSYDIKTIDIERHTKDFGYANQPGFDVTIQAINTGLIFKF